MVCSHCGIAGHTYRRCPTITPEEKKAKEEEIKKEKEERAQRRNARNARRHAMNLHLHAAFQNMNGVNQQPQPTPHENQIQQVQEEAMVKYFLCLQLQVFWNGVLVHQVNGHKVKDTFTIIQKWVLAAFHRLHMPHFM